MTAEQLIIGNKYVPFQKTVGDNFSDSSFISKDLPFLYFKRKTSSDICVFSESMDTTGDYYNPEDVYEYIESFDGIKRGDLVVIKDSGETYSTHSVAFNKLHFKNKDYNETWKNGTTGIVFGLMFNSERHIMVAVRDNDGKECLIGFNGVELAVQNATEFVLPEKWAIAVTVENKDELSEWRGGNLCDPRGFCLSLHQGYWVRELERYEDYTIISTEQFKQYVLKQTPIDMPTQEQTTQTETKQYPKTPDGLYDMTLDMLNLEVGDIVKVTHKTPSHYMGWENSWCNDMDAMVGNEYEVRKIADTRHGISFTDQPFNFPPYSLEVVSKRKQEASYHIRYTKGRLKGGSGECVTFDQPITELYANDIYWLAKLFIKQGQRDALKLNELQ